MHRITPSFINFLAFLTSEADGFGCLSFPSTGSRRCKKSIISTIPCFSFQQQYDEPCDPIISEEEPAPLFLDGVDGLIQDLLREHHACSDWSTVQQHILQRVDERHQADCTTAVQSPLVMEGDNHNQDLQLLYEWIHIPTREGEAYPIALESTRPIFMPDEIDLIRSNAEAIWAAQKQQSTSSSRFTYQRPGNYEAHVAELGPSVTSLMNRVLEGEIYPIVRRHFATRASAQFPGESLRDMDRLFVYDSLYIRYNATEANEVVGGGAGQPMHRDLSLVSVNIMLNDASEFEGGGTFFENLQKHVEGALDPLRPRGVGHCLLHSSLERHAGANTRSGVRDVMVIFVSAQGPPSANGRPTTPNLLKSSLLKQCMAESATPFWRDCSLPYLCSLCHNRLAIEIVPTDGEAFQYLGNALVACAEQFHGQDDPKSLSILSWACQSYERAIQYAPNDGRAYNNLGLAYIQLRDRSPLPPVNDAMIDRVFAQGQAVLDQQYTAGCDVTHDRNAIRLNYGLFLANQDDWPRAYSTLASVAEQTSTDETNSIILNAQKLCQMCQRELAKS